MKIELNKKLEKFLTQIHHIMKEKRSIKASVQSIANNMLLLHLAEHYDISLTHDLYEFPPESSLDEFLETFIRGVKIYVKGDFEDKDCPDLRTPEERLQEHLEWFARHGLALTRIISNNGDNIEIEFIEPKNKVENKCLDY